MCLLANGSLPVIKEGYLRERYLIKTVLMNRPSFRLNYLTWVVACVVVSGTSWTGISRQAQRPNIIYIMVDDLGYADLSCYGRPDYQTPNIDKLASQGIKFMNAYAAAPVCTPSRAAFMTGQYPARMPVGLIEPLEGSARDSLIGLDPSRPSVAAGLREKGYETLLVGKWHLGIQPESSPLRNGFDYFYGFKAGAVDYLSHKSSNKRRNDLVENDRSIRTEGYMTDLLQAKAIELIRQPRPKPFFMSLMFSAPHWPWQAPGDGPYPDSLSFMDVGSPATYAAMMKSLDDAVGAVMKALDDQNLARNTVVILTSDNGGERFSNMGIYKGRKMQLWEGGIRVPAFVRWPQSIKAGSTTNQVAITMDWTATLLALAGNLPATDKPLDGIDLMPVMTGKSNEIARTLYWRIFQRMQHKAMRKGNWKYLQDEKGATYLFDLTTDPREQTNLGEKQAGILGELQAMYAKWETTVLKPVPLK